ncbi:MAG TPA: SGNH/GDSL hydrolase family protein [Flavitalea sp.]|nr:SGNH/GDSL hydrolase family protein [Flavitalea sp.]
MIQQYLALGDSYTIGEGVALFDSFPYQLTRALREKGIAVSAPEIVAKTGFTTGELLSQLAAASLLHQYQLVTLLIGVNNQYRGLTVDRFRMELDSILEIALQATGNAPARVHVLSIPDYGKSPFARQLDQEKITEEIRLLNYLKAEACNEKRVSFTDITTTGNRVPGPDLFAEDGLHPAPAEYRRWVELLLQNINLNVY